jgi:hypothetical protein
MFGKIQKEQLSIDEVVGDSQNEALDSIGCEAEGAQA